MVTNDKELDADEIKRLLHRLDDVLNDRGHRVELYVVGPRLSLGSRQIG